MAEEDKDFDRKQSASLIAVSDFIPHLKYLHKEEAERGVMPKEMMLKELKCI